MAFDAGAQLAASWGLTVFNILAQRNEQLPRQRYDTSFPIAFGPVIEASFVPFAQFAVRLIVQPHPRNLDHQAPELGAPRLADALLAFAVSTVVRYWN